MDTETHRIKNPEPKRKSSKNRDSATKNRKKNNGAGDRGEEEKNSQRDWGFLGESIDGRGALAASEHQQAVGW
ncbi:hypothetical protein E2562_000515 [Oryza meyeriana var. granulata]|uniref:Uncharacterized protein n=1 Tax=Oryza meyeriana var. granulata TaxID=110450 RepID=A0A6G1CC79_9ORYZ|nr:hypothetical protein E2562_000515 [Oryza meyeriana var. granulata]